MMYRIQIFNVIVGINKEKTFSCTVHIYKERPKSVISNVTVQNELGLGTYK